MNRSGLLECLRSNARDIIEEFLPPGANAELECLIGEHRHEIDAQAFLIFVSVRALLRESGLPSCELDCEAGQIMALLNSRAA
ncbi:hypothetical protein M3I54_17030 [Paraburkholderia sp. CNPSo 3274]|uniref:hypothetical protein n=1 Tax=Paraburkholderia sp. CNPSo 3274 TaxID=2940932 RepID=UPI0020B81C70|nr:hypothetical protein [Paraburkholderia sp. CNPSo 3274]MCP3708676.1 hypothetical protein [Paraburkholderia sp. CNPSo 3274]